MTYKIVKPNLLIFNVPRSIGTIKRPLHGPTITEKIFTRTDVTLTVL